MFSYLYEIRRGDEILATGHLARDEPLDVGETITIAGHRGIVRSIDPQLGDLALHLIIQAMPNG